MDHLVIPVSDQARSRRFYETYFGFGARPARRCDDGVLMLYDAAGFALALGPAEQPVPRPAWMHFGRGLSDRDAVHALRDRLAADGVELVEESDERDYVSVKCRDPDGYIVEASWEPESDAAAVVRRYFEIVSDLGSSRDALLEVLDPAVRITEHPNAINPRGTVRNRDGAVAGFMAGKGLLKAQSIEILELVVSGDRVAVRANWRGTIGAGTPALRAGTELVAHLAAWLTVADGRIRAHETFDCYEPLPGT